MPHSPRRHLLALAALLLAGCASPEERFAHHVTRGEEFVQAGQHDEALLEYSSALKIQPDDAEINQRVGELLRRSGSLAEAALFYRSAHRLDPQRLDAAMAEADLIRFSDKERAGELLADALERAPDAPVVQRTRAEFALVRGNIPEALEAARRAIELEPDAAQNWAQLGRVYKGRIQKRKRKQLELGDDIYRDAIEAYERANELAGGDVGSLVERARVLGAWPGHETEGEQAFYRAMVVAKEKGLRDEQLFVAEAAFDFSRIKRRLRLRSWALREIVRVSPERLSAWQRLVRLEDGRHGGGEDVLRELLEVRPDDPAAHVLYATYLTNNARGDEAIAYLSTAIEDGPDSPVLREKLVRVAIEQLEFEAARRAVEAMADEFPDELSTRRAQARVAIVNGQRDHAAKLLRKLAVEFENAETLRLLAIAEHQLGNLPAASAAIDRAVRLSPEFSPAIMRLKARIHHDAEEWRLVLRTLIEIDDRGFELDGPQRLMQVRALYGRGMKADGAAALDALLAGPNPPAGAAIEYARREGLRHPGKARRYLLAALARRPGSYELLKVLTRLELRDGRSRAALVYLDRVVESGSAGPLVLLLRAEVLIALNQLARAEADALRAFEVAPGLPRAADLLFSLYRAQGSLDETRRSFEEAQAAGVLHPGARILLARLYAHQGETVKARETLEDLLADRPQMPLAQTDLALLMADEGEDLDRALELARAAEQALSRSPYTADSVGYVYFRMGRNEAALEQFRNAIDLAKDQSEPIPPPLHYHLGLALRALDRNPAAARHFAKALALDSDFPGAEDARRQLEAARSLDPEATNPS